MGGVVAVVAMSPPVHAAADTSVTGHMAQHVLLLAVAGPVLGTGVARTMQQPRGRGEGPLRRTVGQGVVHPAAPLAAAAIAVGTMVLWHLPGPYDATLVSPALHLAAHATLLGSATLLFATVGVHSTGRGVLASVSALFLTASAGAALGVVLMFAPSPLYAHGDLSDQQYAGVLMAAGTSVLYVGAAMVVLLRLLTEPPSALLVAVIGIAIAPLLMGTGAAQGGQLERQQEPVPAARDTTEHEEGLAVGEQLYGRDCASCHGLDGRGSHRGTSLEGLGAAGVHYAVTTGRMPIPAPDAAIRRRDPVYTDDEVEALVAYTAGLVEGPAVPAVDLAEANLARGGHLYRLHCAQCHSSTGIGGALALGEYAPHVFNATPVQVASAVLVGPGTMPSFAATFSHDDLNAVAAHVALLADPPGQGVRLPGARVSEGLVAWLAGFGALAIAAALIGTRARSRPRTGMRR